MSENENPTTGKFDNFIYPCLTCGTTVHVVNGQTQPHECADLPAGDRVAYAWWQGYDAAKASVERERDELRAEVERYRTAFLKANEACSVREEALVRMQERDA